MVPEGIEPAVPASEQPQTHALDRTATGIGVFYWPTFISLLLEIINLRCLASMGGSQTWYFRIESPEQEILTFCAMEPFESLVKPRDLFSE
jgi:hypothetical protein